MYSIELGLLNGLEWGERGEEISCRDCMAQRQHGRRSLVWYGLTDFVSPKEEIALR